MLMAANLPSAVLVDVACHIFKILHVHRQLTTGVPMHGGGLATICNERVIVHFIDLLVTTEPSTFEVLAAHRTWFIVIEHRHHEHLLTIIIVSVDIFLRTRQTHCSIRFSTLSKLLLYMNLLSSLRVHSSECRTCLSNSFLRHFATRSTPANSWLEFLQLSNLNLNLLHQIIQIIYK